MSKEPGAIHELVPLKENWREFVEREVKPFVSDAWVDDQHRDMRDGEVGRVGYEINFQPVPVYRL